ncbi:MAG: peptidylprolyl isomerase [Candidatus Aminicenantes bacterium]|nr:MAG: peptidylprolyl isomerase [Candidatus Aminicenantes bacterium]
MANTVKKGDKVKVHYTGRFEDGKVFDSSVDREPLDVEVGGAQVIQGFEDGLVGMQVGEKKTISVSPEEGYGQCDPALLIEIPNANIPEGVTPEIGMKLKLGDSKGQSVMVTVTDVGEESIQLDANHPLAGKVLVFDLELVSIF